MANKIDFILRMSLSDWKDMLEAWGRLLSLRLRQPRLDLEEIKPVEISLQVQEPVAPPALERAQRLQKLVSMAARLHVFRSACLPRARCLHRMLERQGIASRLCIGATRNLAGFASHAWVEVGGQAVGEPQDISDRFSVLAPGKESAN